MGRLARRGSIGISGVSRRRAGTPGSSARQRADEGLMMPSRQSSWRPLSFAAAALVLLVAGAVRVASSERQTAPAARSTDDHWWKREPIRFLQTNLSENDSTADPRALV